MDADPLRSFYDSLVQYASDGPNHADFTLGRQQFTSRTGDLFESDPAFERRICAFLEWFTIDRALAPPLLGQTMLHKFVQDTPMTPLQKEMAQAWQLSLLSLLMVSKIGPKGCVLDDLLLSQRYVVAPTSATVGLGPKDIIAGRVVAWKNSALLTDGVSYFPRSANKIVARIAKKYRKSQVPGVSRIDVMHRLIYLANRCERYRHVEPQRIFAEGEAQVTLP